MKKYIKNKGFIPEAFIEKVEHRNQKAEKKVLILFLCINLICMPFSITLINKNKDKKVEKINEQSYTEKEGLAYDNVYNMIQTLLSDDIKECDVSNDGGSLIIDDINKVEELNDEKIINVDDVLLKDDRTFEVRVNAYEKSMD